MLLRLDRYRWIAILFVVSLQHCCCRVVPQLRVSSLARSLATPCGVDMDGNGSLIVGSCDVCAIHRILPTGSVSVVAGVIGTCSFANGFGSSAKFSYPSTVVYDKTKNAVYIADQHNDRVRMLDLSTFYVSTVIGSTSGFRNGAFSVALFNQCNAFVLLLTAAGSVLYITDFYNDLIRKADFSSTMVTTVASVGEPCLIALTKDGLRLFVSSDSSAVYQIAVVNGSVTAVAGAYGAPGFTDAVGSFARFNRPRGLALNQDDTVLFVTDWMNRRIRRIQLWNRSVTTVAGTGAQSSVDGPLLSASFIGLGQAIWHCNALTDMCGIITCDYSPGYATGNVRWIPLTQGTLSMSASEPTRDVTFTSTITPSRTFSTTMSARTPSVTPSNASTESMSATKSVSRRSRSRTMFVSSEDSASRSVTPSANDSLSSSMDTSTSRNTTSISTSVSTSTSFSKSAETDSRDVTLSQPTRSVSCSSTSTPTFTLTSSPSAPTLSRTPTWDATLTNSRRTRTKSSSQFDCSAMVPFETGVALGDVTEAAAMLSERQHSNNSVTVVHRSSSLTDSSAFAWAYAVYDATSKFRQHNSTAGEPPSIVVESLAIDRITMLTTQSLAVNLSFNSTTAQLVYYYTRNVTSLDEGIPHYNMTTSIRPRSGVWHMIVVEAPMGWLGGRGDGTTVVPILLDTALTLVVSMGCGDVVGTMMNVMIKIPSPGVPMALAAKVRSASQATLVGSVFGTGALSGSTLGRLLVTASMVRCDVDASSVNGVVGVKFALCNESNPVLISARSAIASNGVLVAAVTTLLLLLGCLWRCATHMSLVVAAATVFLFPSSVAPLVTAVIPSTAASATLIVAQLIRHNSSRASCIVGDVLLLLLATCLVLSPIVLAGFASHTASGRCWRCGKVQVVAASHQVSSPFVMRLRRFAQRQWRWSVGADNGHNVELRAAWVVLLEYRVLWYAAVDALFLVAVSSLAVVGGLDVTNEALCRGCSAAVVVLLGAQVGVLCAWRPYTTLFSLVYNVATTALTCVSVAAQLAFVLTSFTSTSGLWLVDASAVCNLLVLGLSVVKMLLDAWDLWSAVRRRFSMFHDLLLHRTLNATLKVVDSVTNVPDSIYEAEVKMEAFLAGIDFSTESSDSGAAMNVALNSKLVNETTDDDDGPFSSDRILGIDNVVAEGLVVESVTSSDEDGSLVGDGPGAVVVVADSLFWDHSGHAVGTSHAEEEENEILNAAIL